MRIIQLIDSLEAGGAERMAVNYANALVSETGFAGLVATRSEGQLKQFINSEVRYLFLKRKATFDVPAALRLKKFCKSNNAMILHAHSSSYFLAVLTKLLYPKLKIVWHDHNGMSEFLEHRRSPALRLLSVFFSGIISVNQLLKEWAERYLLCKKVLYLENFILNDELAPVVQMLKGTAGKRIICVANLREQKNHHLLLNVALRVKQTFPGWTFHLIGKDFEDRYSEQIKHRIKSESLEEVVFLYGSVSEPRAFVGQANIAILTSISEGLPVSLLEYGLEKKAVVVTNVGEIGAVVNHKLNGLMVASNDADAFFEQISNLITDPRYREQLGAALHTTIEQCYSHRKAIQQYMNFLRTILHVG